MVDINKKVWGYQASTNPSVPNELSFGDATTLTLMLYPTRSALKQVTGFAPYLLWANQDKARVVGMSAPEIEYSQRVIARDGPIDETLQLCDEN